MQKLILFVHIAFTSVYCYPCDGIDAWKCPNDSMCIRSVNELCAPPPFNIQRCPNGGDFGESVCSEQFCGILRKCPFDPFCLWDMDIPESESLRDSQKCYECPHGATNEFNCARFSTRSDMNKCGSKRYQKYYLKWKHACNNVVDCPEDGGDELNCNNDRECKKETPKGFKRRSKAKPDNDFQPKRLRHLHGASLQVWL